MIATWSFTLPDQLSDSATWSFTMPDQLSDSATWSFTMPDQLSDSATRSFTLPDQLSDSATRSFTMPDQLSPTPPLGPLPCQISSLRLRHLVLYPARSALRLRHLVLLRSRLGHHQAEAVHLVTTAIFITSPNMRLCMPVGIWEPCERCKTSAAMTASLHIGVNSSPV